MSKSISVANAKGGVGKTSLALQICGALAAAGKKVQLVDLDSQGSALTFADVNRGKVAKGEALPIAFRVAASAADGYDFTVYDHPPGLPQKSAGGDVVLVPTLLDANSWGATVRFITELQRDGTRPFIVVPNRVELGTADQAAYLAVLFKDQPFIRKRVGLQRAVNSGVTIYDEKNGIPLANLIRDEFNAVMKDLVGLMNGKPWRRYDSNGKPL